MDVVGGLIKGEGPVFFLLIRVQNPQNTARSVYLECGMVKYERDTRMRHWLS